MAGDFDCAANASGVRHYILASDYHPVEQALAIVLQAQLQVPIAIGDRDALGSGILRYRPERLAGTNRCQTKHCQQLNCSGHHHALLLTAYPVTALSV
jgi:hypothetical protein